ncbi:MAG: hypothetical protein KatS3mg100_423 [Candidatus Parcubacteria bacterium]|nr:MAG: hypothetical protein KatS3mg100_423 [Candidatus Parcubacteria bacterium]
MPKKPKAAQTFSKAGLATRRAWIWLLVWCVPRGRVTTYAVLARALGLHPRAVALALRSNTSPLIPCHRVVHHNGALGGYNRGREQKRRLLQQEGVWKNSGIDMRCILEV